MTGIKHVLLVLPLLVGSATDYYVVGPGTVSYASPGVLEQVAERRIKNGWGIPDHINLSDYEVLGATIDCTELGRNGYIVTDKTVKSILIVDCENSDHKGQMAKRQLVVDVNDKSLVHETAYLILWRTKQ